MSKIRGVKLGPFSKQSFKEKSDETARAEPSNTTRSFVVSLSLRTTPWWGIK